MNPEDEYYPPWRDPRDTPQEKLRFESVKMGYGLRVEQVANGYIVNVTAPDNWHCPSPMKNTFVAKDADDLRRIVSAVTNACAASVLDTVAGLDTPEHMGL